MQTHNTMFAYPTTPTAQQPKLAVLTEFKAQLSTSPPFTVDTNDPAACKAALSQLRFAYSRALAAGADLNAIHATLQAYIDRKLLWIAEEKKMIFFFYL